MAAVTDM